MRRIVSITDICRLLSRSRTSVEGRLSQNSVRPLNPGRRPALYDLDSPQMQGAMQLLGAPLDAEGQLIIPDGFVTENPWTVDYEFGDLSEGEKPASAKGLVRADLELQKIQEQVLTLEIANKKKRRELIERSAVQKLLAQLFSIDTIELGTLADVIGDELLALCDKGRPSLREIKDVVSSGVARTVEHINRRIIEFARTEMGASADVRADDLVVKEPVVDEPVVDEPVVDEPVVEEPVVEEPVVEEPVVEEPVVEEPVVEEPVVEEPVVKKVRKADSNPAPPDMIDGRLNPAWVEWVNSRNTLASDSV